MASALDDDLATCRVLVVGAGLFGLTVAERIAATSDHRVCVIDKRSTVGGNAYSYFDPRTGIEIHKYGSHLFHTSNRKVWDYVRRFTLFNDYRHQVWTQYDGRVFPMPINLATLSLFYGRHISPDEARKIVEDSSEVAVPEEDSLEAKAIRQVGRPLYEALIRGYTEKQWQTDPRQLPSSTISRLPMRFNFDMSYFSDTWQGLPLLGYEAWFKAMTNYPGISIHCDTDFFDIRDSIGKDMLVVYTGPIDRYFDFRFGTLAWRTLDFEIQWPECEDFQGIAVMNFADSEIPWTRIHEFKHLHPERSALPRTVIMREYSRFAAKDDEPYYPVNASQDRSRLLEYRIAAQKEARTFFGGRLGSYQYLDMHMAIASALSMFENEIRPTLGIPCGSDA